MGQYQTRSSRSVDEDHSLEESGSMGRESDRSRRIPHAQEETTTPLAPVFGSPIDSKLIKSTILARAKSE